MLTNSLDRCAFVECVMHTLVLRTFGKGHLLVDAAEIKLIRIAGRSRGEILLNLLRKKDGEGCGNDVMVKQASNTICMLWAAWAGVCNLPFDWVHPYNIPSPDTLRYEWEISNVVRNRVCLFLDVCVLVLYLNL